MLRYAIYCDVPKTWRETWYKVSLYTDAFLFSAMAEANGLFAIYWAVLMQIPPTLYKI